MKGKKAVKLQDLPITTSAAHQHILRIYHQVQEWIGDPDHRLDPSSYGWRLSNGLYTPATGVDNVCPAAITEMICCNCKKDCSSQSCGCKKLGVQCTELCNCSALCTNSEHDDNVENDSDEDEEYDVNIS